jgi:hypothetical protein
MFEPIEWDDIFCLASSKERVHHRVSLSGSMGFVKEVFFSS